MVLIFYNHKFQYELERVFRSFFPPIELKLSFDMADAMGEYCITEVIERPTCYTLSVELKTESQYFFASEDISKGETEKERERLLCVLLYKILREYTGHDMPWGIVSGVRPVKLLSSMGENYLEGKMLVSRKKIDLAKKVERVQQPILRSLDSNKYHLYISVPFCPTRCSYCSFVSHSVDKVMGRMDEYVDRLIDEMNCTAEIAKKLGMQLDTIYMGGGTPTTLSAEQLSRVLNATEVFDRSQLREFTVEAGRPDTITKEKLFAIKAAGVGRISVNPQTMNDSVLEAIGRKHTAQQVIEAYELARDMSFDCINMDLIAGLPTDTPESFRSTLQQVLELQPENITVHSLAIKRSSSLFKEWEKHPSTHASQMVEYAHRILAEDGYAPYYLYRQNNIAGNQENTGYSISGKESIYNIVSMEDAGTILAVGAGAATKLVKQGNERNDIFRISNHKYPYEYLDRFNEILEQKQPIFGFFE